MRILFGMLLCLSTWAVAEDPTAIVNGPMGEQFDAYFTAMVDYGFAGAILVAKDGEIVIAKGYGLAHREKAIPVTTNTVFSVGSITKQFTGAAIMKLVEEEKLSVDDPITKFFDDVPEKRRDITIHHLLTHTAGNRESVKGDFDLVTREEIVEIALKGKVFAHAGKRHRYSNAGYSILGAIIEKVSGMGYEEYLHKNLLKPAGMLDTGYLIPKWDSDRVAHGYIFNEYWGTVLDRPWLDDGPGWVLRANGGIHSTIWDMYAWHQALLDDSVLSDASRKQMFTPHVSEGRNMNSHYGYGWAISPTERDTTLISHNGGNGIMFADFRRYIGDDIVIFYMTSTAPLIENQNERDIRRIVFGFPVVMPPFDARANREER